jgi:hypothetical protein
MKLSGFLWFFTIILLVSCIPSAPKATPETITVQYTIATTPWLQYLDNCAGTQVINAELRPADFQDLESSNMVMRIGLPARLISTAYQIGTDDLLVIINPQNHVNELTADQVRAIFTGRIQTWKAINGTDALIQVWVYSEGEDVQQVFEKSVLRGSPVTSLARLANSPEEMSQAVLNNPSAVGIITRRLKTGNTSDIFTAASSLPVLVFTRSEPQGSLAQILACLQK